MEARNKLQQCGSVYVAGIPFYMDQAKKMLVPHDPFWKLWNLLKFESVELELLLLVKLRLLWVHLARLHLKLHLHLLLHLEHHLVLLLGCHHWHRVRNKSTIFTSSLLLTLVAADSVEATGQAKWMNWSRIGLERANVASSALHSVNRPSRMVYSLLRVSLCQWQTSRSHLLSAAKTNKFRFLLLYM